MVCAVQKRNARRQTWRFDLRACVKLEVEKLIEPVAWKRCEVVNEAEQSRCVLCWTDGRRRSAIKGNKNEHHYFAQLCHLRPPLHRPCHRSWQDRF